MITLQVNKENLYCSGLINERYQILESEVVRNNYYIYDHVKSDNVKDKNFNSTLYFDSIRDAEYYISPTDKVKTKKVIPENKTVMKREPSTGRKETAFSYLISLIKNTELNDEDIATKVKEKYENSNYTYSMVKFHRKKMLAEKNND